MKKLIVLFVFVGLFIGLFVGCSSVPRYHICQSFNTTAKSTIGDLVQIRSGGVSMTVMGYYWTSGADSVWGVKCQWFQNGATHNATFDPRTLCKQVR